MPAHFDEYFFAPLTNNKNFFMCNRNKSTLRIIPAAVVSALLLIGAILKIFGVHPMMLHFFEMGLAAYVKMLGAAEIIIVVLYLLPPTSKIGLLLLTGYLGGAMAAEIPYNLLAAPAIPLMLAWAAAYLRDPSLFLEKPKRAIHTF